MDNDDVIDTLNGLIETSKDGEYGFRSSAENVQAASIKQMLLQRAESCRLGATQLQSLVARLGGTAEDGGSTTGAMHRGWVAVKAKLSSYSDREVLEECERGEDAAMERYRKALEQALPPEVRAVVEQQFEGVKRNHADVRNLRDQARAASA
jgi:uncharacterized protein (TIGR02284 family)